MRIGIFGGTFDPVHVGHLIVAEQCREQVNLDELWFMPSAQPPHKQGQPLTPFEQRRDMLELAIAGHASFRVSTVEQELGGLSFTVRTLAEVHQRYPGNDWFLLLGGDCLPDLPGWREPEAIVAQATLIAVARPGYPVWNVAQLSEALKLRPGLELKLRIAEVPLIDIASRDVRRRVAERRSIRFMVPRAVQCYIEQHGLFLSNDVR